MRHPPGRSQCAHPSGQARVLVYRPANELKRLEGPPAEAETPLEVDVKRVLGEGAQRRLTLDVGDGELLSAEEIQSGGAPRPRLQVERGGDQQVRQVQLARIGREGEDGSEPGLRLFGDEADGVVRWTVDAQLEQQVQWGILGRAGFDHRQRRKVDDAGDFQRCRDGGLGRVTQRRDVRFQGVF